MEKTKQKLATTIAIRNNLRVTAHSQNLCGIVNREMALVGEVQMLSTRFDNLK